MIWGKTKPPFGVRINHSHPLSQGIVGCWLFNEGEGDTVLDSSGNNHNGKIWQVPEAIKPGIWKPGIFGKTLRFGTEHVHITESILAPLKKLTLSLWFMCDDASSDGRQLMGRWYVNGFMLWYNGGKLSMAIDSAPYVTGNTDIRDGKIYHCVGTHDGITSKIYVNSILENQQDESPPTTVTDGTYPFTIGQYATVDTVPRGLIDMPIIYNRSLTQNEITQLYREPFCIFNE